MILPNRQRRCSKMMPEQEDVTELRNRINLVICEVKMRWYLINFKALKYD